MLCIITVLTFVRHVASVASRLRRRLVVVIEIATFSVVVAIFRSPVWETVVFVGVPLDGATVLTVGALKAIVQHRVDLVVVHVDY